MNLLDNLRIAIQALCINKLRSILTALGIIVGVAAVVCVVSIASGARSDISQKIRTLGANLLLIRPGAENAGGARLEAGSGHTLTEADAAAIRRETPGVQVVAPLLSHPAHIAAERANWATIVAGITRDYLIAREWIISRGRTFTSHEIEAGDKVAIVGSDIVQQLFAGRSGLGETARIGDVPFTLIGVLEKKGEGAAGLSQDDVVFIPLSAAQGRVLGSVRGGSRRALDLLLVKVSDPITMPEVTRQIATLLRQRHHLRDNAPDDFSIHDPADILSARRGTLYVLGVLLMSVASVSLIIGGIGVMNVMLVSVAERTREVGLRMAIGARRRDIGRQFLAEALALTLGGGLLGVGLGAGAASVIGWQLGWPVYVSPLATVSACGAAACVGMFFGIYPAYRASRVDAITALRAE